MLIRAIVWLWRAFLKAVLYLILPTPPNIPAIKPKKVDLEAVCPSCGHGPLTIETVTVTTNPNRPASMRKALLQWQCSVCKGRTYTEPLMGTDADKLHGREIIGL